MDQQQIAQALNDLYLLHAELEKLQKERQSAIDAILPDEIKQQIEAINLEVGPKLTVAMQKISALETVIIEETLKLEKTVKGKKLQAIFRHGNLTWNTGKLIELSKTTYQILACRKHGKNGVRIAKV